MLAWVPYVGSIVGCMLVVMVASTDAPADPAVAYMAIGVFIAVRLLDDFVFMPLTLGRSLHIHPLITVLMIFIGGSVAGVAGLMLVLPLLGVVMVVGETLGRLITDPRLRARHPTPSACVHGKPAPIWSASKAHMAPSTCYCPLDSGGDRLAAGAAALSSSSARIRWSKADSAALAPSPVAMMICLYGTVVTSPAANTPGTEVWPRLSISISP
jgi:hypothetical protein